MPVTYNMDYMAYIFINQIWGQDDWILAEFFFCIFKDWDKIEVHKDAQEVWGWYRAILTNQVWL